jgi:predicted Zn-dependent protease
MLLVGCAEVHVNPFTTAPERADLGPEQRVVWQSSDQQDDAFQNIGADYDDPAVQAYVQGIVDHLYPEFKGSIHVRLLKSTVPNAFMMANGSCYVQLGLLSLLQDEPSLAMVLAHEGIHFVDQHAVQEHAHTGDVAAALGVAVPIIGPALAMSSIRGYSVEMETQADQSGYQRYLRAGYPASGAVAPFLALDKYSQAMDIKESYFYADHPKLQNRIAYFEAQAAGAQPAADAAAAVPKYLPTTAAARLWVLQELLARHDHKTLLFLLEDPARLSEYPDYAPYYLASAYVIRNSDGDGARAEGLYRQVITKAPGFAPSYAALGKLLLHRGDATGAKPLLQTYLKLAPDAPDRSYIQFDLQHLADPAPAPHDKER